MRTIKFRGQRVDTKEWVYGDLIHGQGGKTGKMYILPQTQLYPSGCSELDGWEVIPETVGQLTGRTDKNGKEAYDGDVGVRYLDAKKIYTDGKTWKDYWRVEWYKSGFITVIIADYNVQFGKMVREPYQPNKYSTRFDEIEIFGNIHDNPELL